MSKSKLYLLGGNGSNASWWKFVIPHFKNYEPVAIELPGFGSNTSHFHNSYNELAHSLINQTEPGNEILACGINALTVLHSVTINPSHFSKITLLSPIGAFLWERKFVKLMSVPGATALLKFFLSNFPKLFKNKFTDSEWNDENFNIISNGYKECRAFKSYFNFTSAINALDLFDYIKSDIRIIWGTQDRIVGVNHLAAWDTILKRANLSITIKDNWGHYPFFDSPEEFCETVENFNEGFYSHTKAGRLRLAKLSGLNVPEFEIVKHKNSNFKIPDARLFVVRSSFQNEDGADESSAGLHESFIKVKREEIHEKVNYLFDSGADEVVVQKFIEPEVSGIAFVRNISTEIEWVEGHLGNLTSGKVQPYKSVISKMKNGWEVGWNHNMDDAPFIVMISYLNELLLECIKKFHFEHCDIEWAWDGKNFHLLQVRPVTSYGWRRLITSANLDEILPKQVSNLLYEAQTKAAKSIGTVYSLWDKRTLEDSEPFTVDYNNAHYINCDLFLSRFKDWGLPASLFFREIGGMAPEPNFNLRRFILSFPVFVKMLLKARREIRKTYSKILGFKKELQTIIETSPHHKNELLRQWFIRYYLFIVRTNILLKACLSSSAGSFMGRPKTVYSEMFEKKFPHRVKYESDPASHRGDKTFSEISKYPNWNLTLRLWDSLGLPGMRGRYTEVREWFRDNNMKLFQLLHFELIGSTELEKSNSLREKSGTFWQDSGLDESVEYTDSQPIIIYPGSAEGIVGVEILIVEALEPGHFEEYKKAKAVIAKTGGQLSHGATLLRELKKPSSINSGVELNIQGDFVRYTNGKIIVQNPSDN